MLLRCFITPDALTVSNGDRMVSHYSSDDMVFPCLNAYGRVVRREGNTTAPDDGAPAGALQDCSIYCDLPDGSPCSSFLPYDSPVSISPQDEDGHCWVRLAEVVEVKSSCPFYALDSRPSKASCWGHHSSSGLRQNVPPMYIAQVSSHHPSAQYPVLSTNNLLSAA